MKKKLFAVGKTIIHPVYGRGVICLTDTRGQGWIYAKCDDESMFGCLPSEVTPEQAMEKAHEELPPRGDHP